MVLGVLRTQGPCTAYRVRRALRASPSTFWSASAGAIYPLLRKLEAAGLVHAALDGGDKRGRRLLRVTPKGRKAHLAWMKAISSADVVAAVSDPVRSRAFFLATLPPEDRRRFVQRALESLEQYLEDTRKDLHLRAEGRDSFAYWAALGGVYQAESRVKWMRALQGELEGQGGIPTQPSGEDGPR